MKDHRSGNKKSKLFDITKMRNPKQTGQFPSLIQGQDKRGTMTLTKGKVPILGSSPPEESDRKTYIKSIKAWNYFDTGLLIYFLEFQEQ
jgi:hypothetical protein